MTVVRARAGSPRGSIMMPARVRAGSPRPGLVGVTAGDGFEPGRRLAARRTGFRAVVPSRADVAPDGL